MPRKVDPSELSAVSRQILSRMSDPPVDLNDLWVVPTMSRLMLKSAKRASLIENLRSLRGLGKMRVR
jgi:hypothetical protein